MDDRDEAREHFRELAAEFARQEEPYRWFEALYREAERGQAVIPWDNLAPNANLVAFWKTGGWDTSGQTALVVGCGLGDDAEQIAAWGFRTTAFDVAETAIALAKKRFPRSVIDYRVADLFAPPAEWLATFDFVFECNTVQALPADIRARTIEKIAAFVKPGGRLLVIARAREESDPPGQLPWPLTRRELNGFVRAGLGEESIEDINDSEPPWVRRFRVLYLRP